MKRHLKIGSSTIFSFFACMVVFGILLKQPVTALVLFVVMELICKVMDDLVGRSQWDNEKNREWDNERDDE